jgi:hypothetical protein
MKNYNSKKISFILVSFLVIFILSDINSTIRYVSKTGSSEPPFLTWETAADSIQECINISVFGDTIYVANGVYQERVVMIPGLSLIGSGTDSCEINTQPYATTTSYRSVVVDDFCLFKGFKIVVANNTNLGGGIAGTAISSLITENRFTRALYGITNGSNATIYKNLIDHISTGMYLVNSNALVRSNTIYTDPNSTAAVIAGIRISAFTNSYVPVIDSNYIENDNATGLNIRKDLGSSPVIINNIIILKGIANGAINTGTSGNVRIFNNSIIAITGYDGIYSYASDVEIINNQITGKLTSYGINNIGPYEIVKNNNVTKVGKGIGVSLNQNLIIQNNNSWNNTINYGGFTPDTTNLTVDPMIVNDDTTQGDLDFHLQKYSPLIDAGDPTILDKDSTRSDIGLYGGPYGESYIYVDLPPRTPVNLTANVDSLIKLNWNKNTEADFSYYNVYRDTTFDFTVDSTKLIASVTDTFYFQMFPSNIETLYYKLTAVDNQGNESNPSEQVSVKLVTVKNEWIPVNNYILDQNYPNPFNPSTKIGYKLKERGYVKLYVYDIKGELVSVLVNQTQEAGYYEVEFNAEVKGQMSNVKGQLASGVYIYQIFVKGENNIPVFSDIKKMVYVK